MTGDVKKYIKQKKDKFSVKIEETLEKLNQGGIKNINKIQKYKNHIRYTIFKVN